MPIQCQRCKAAPATVHLTDIAQGEKYERHLCADCAEEEGVVMKTQQAPLNEIVTKFIMHKAAAQELADLTCPQCGLTFVEFRGSGLLGCPNDYVAFQRALDPLIERSHGGTLQHVGKVPNRAGNQVQSKISLIRLRRELQQAITEEDYELAARLRDQIKELETP
ncbi:MAG: Protein-arginine kinase activator protein [Phycisphaerae bacterium]|nr:Protein-arginine kinase activator protein [Phycisphaerae bacterium]